MQKHGHIAFITTPEYRKNHPENVKEFIFRYMYHLCNWFDVLSTGRTYDHVRSIVSQPIDQVNRSLVENSTLFPIDNENDLERWRKTIYQGLRKVLPSVEGMIEISYELVEGRLDAIIHLTDWADVAGKPDSMVLRREANVHNIPIASDIHTAEAMLATWGSLIAIHSPNKPIFPERKAPEELPLNGLKIDDRVLALIAHDQMKLEMCCFFVEHATKIFNEFDFILATGTTGKWIKRFAEVAGCTKHEIKKVRCCLSGPYGGDVQIAAAVVKKLCRKVIFLQDPFTSHAHETDIRLFEQAVLLFERAAVKGLDIELATNVASAKSILGL